MGCAQVPASVFDMSKITKRTENSCSRDLPCYILNIISSNVEYVCVCVPCGSKSQSVDLNLGQNEMDMKGMRYYVLSHSRRDKSEWRGRELVNWLSTPDSSFTI